jgi:hypothetical protein
MITITKRWFEKVRGVFFGVTIAGLALSFALTSCKSDATEDAPADEQPGSTTVQRRMDNERLVALAVGRVFDGKDISVKSFSQNMDQAPLTRLNTDDQTPHIKYDFDFIQIDDAVRFLAKDIDFPFLNEICGEGEIEVFLTSFKTFVYADDTKNMKNIKLFIPDDLIVFRGEWGMYTCMSNSGAWRYDDWDNFISYLIQYSSHKRFSGNAIEKDFTPPLYQFYIKTENNVASLACVASDVLGDPPDESAQWTILEGGENISSEDMFSPEELTSLSEMSQQCTITGVGDGYFLVGGELNLEKIYFDEYTLFFADGKPADPTDFAKGDAVTVTFGKLYERYNPKVATANKIEK